MAITYKAANGKNYNVAEGYKGTWHWEQGDNDNGPFASLDEAIKDAKRHSEQPVLSSRPCEAFGSDEVQINDYYKATRL